MKIKLSFLIFLTLIIQSCNKDSDNTPYSNSRLTESLDVKYVQGMMSTAYNAVKNQGVFALEASRVYAYTAITAYEAMIHGMPDNRSLAGQLEGLNSLPKPDEDKEYNWAYVMNVACSEVLEKTFTSASTSTQSLIWKNLGTIESYLISEYQISKEVQDNSFQYGKELATSIIEWSRSDRAADVGSLPFVMPSLTNNPQYYDGNGVGTPFFMMPFWWSSRPFAISSHRICLPVEPYPYSEDPSSPYYKDVLEVYESTKDPVKLATGQFWANNPGQSGTPAGSWIGILNQFILQQEIDIISALKAYVTMTIATRDAFIVVWYTKYKWNLQRPVSYIRRMMGEPNWISPVPTPPYPDYVSGTSANAGSSSEVLTTIFGSKSFTDRQHVDKNFAPRTYINFKEAGVEAYHSRIYAGVHMRLACVEGFKLGECVAREVMSNISFDK